MKLRSVSGEKKIFERSRIVEIDDENEIALEKMANISQSDSYELFCKWLKENDNRPITRPEHEQPSILTEDEVSSFATNSDDSECDIFLDTESDFPIIVLTNDQNESTFNSIENNTLNGIEPLNEHRVDTPSQLSVSDYDGSSSDITATSASSNQIKRKAKHKKGRAPPIPTLNPNLNHENIDSTTDKFIQHKMTDDLLKHSTEYASIMRSAP